MKESVNLRSDAAREKWETQKNERRHRLDVKQIGGFHHEVKLLLFAEVDILVPYFWVRGSPTPFSRKNRLKKRPVQTFRIKDEGKVQH